MTSSNSFSFFWEDPTPELPRLGDVLATEELQRGAPLVVAGEHRLDNTVRWVHVSELGDIAKLLQGGELILTTGLGLPDQRVPLQRYVADLARVGAAGIVVELGRRYRELPRHLVEAARARSLPLIELRHEISFVKVTEAVHSDIVDRHVHLLRHAQRVHHVFTELGIEGASADVIVQEAAAVSGLLVVLENTNHRVLAAHGSSERFEDVLDGWARRSRAISSRAGIRIVEDGPDLWMVGDVAARGERWGRLLMKLDIATAARPQAAASIFERALMALVISRLTSLDGESLDAEAERNLILRLRSGISASPNVEAARLEALGVPVRSRNLIAALIRFNEPGSEYDRSDGAAVAMVTRALRTCRIDGIAGRLPGEDVGLVLSLPAHPDHVIAHCLTALAKRIRALLGDGGLTIGVGRPVGSLRRLRESFTEADQVCAAFANAPVPTNGYYMVDDIRLFGLVRLLRDDPRVGGFVERQLGAILSAPSADAAEMLDTLRAFLDAGGNKSAAAEALGVSRPTLYQRLRRIERLLEARLDDVETRTGLQFALLVITLG